MTASPREFARVSQLIYRFSKENFPKILKLAEELQYIGQEFNATAGQVALAWLLAQGDDVILTPGTKKMKVGTKLAFPSTSKFEYA